MLAKNEQTGSAAFPTAKENNPVVIVIPDRQTCNILLTGSSYGLIVADIENPRDLAIVRWYNGKTVSMEA